MTFFSFVYLVPMDLFLNYYSVGYQTTALFCLVIVFYLFTLKRKARATVYFALYLLALACLFSGLGLWHSIYAPWGFAAQYLYHLMIFGTVFLIQFAYHFNGNLHQRESKIVFAVTSILSLSAFGLREYFAGGDRIFYIFEHINYWHSAAFELRGKPVAPVIMLQYLWAISVLVRKAFLFSEKDGQKKSFLPAGKKASSCLSFALVIFISVTISALYALTKTNTISYSIFAGISSTTTIAIVFSYVLIYLSNSTEPTTFMTKLVGITLGTVLLISNFMGFFFLNNTEQSYDRQKKETVAHVRSLVKIGATAELPEELLYLLKHPTGSLSISDYKIAFSREATFDQTALAEGHRQALEEASLMAGRPVTELNQKTGSRLYRKADGSHFIEYIFDLNQMRYRAGFSYLDYRQTIHRTAVQIVFSVFILSLFILIFFPFFFRASLVNRLNLLLEGVGAVNRGDLETRVEIREADEIGFLARSFNNMVISIQDARGQLEEHAENLETQVEQRTAELKTTLDEVHKLKVHQDGDYFLTSLLLKPLNENRVSSKAVSVDFLLSQKKKFNFRHWDSEIGGDLCAAHSISLDGREYTAVINGDAMGKSIQGAGGALVLGTVFKSVINRTRTGTGAHSPEEWLEQCLNELHDVFVGFDGTMLISAVLILVDDHSGTVYYINAEHPWPVLYRDRSAGFIYGEETLRKIGIDQMTRQVKVNVFSGQQGDVIILGSDGKDDLLLGTDEKGNRIFNEDENHFPAIVQQADADLPQIEKLLTEKGELTDDLSLVKITLSAAGLAAAVAPAESNLLRQARDLAGDGKAEQAAELLAGAEGHERTPAVLLNLARLHIKAAEYKQAVQISLEGLQKEPSDNRLLNYASVALKKTGALKEAARLCERLRLREPAHTANLLNLADLYRLMSVPDKAKQLVSQVLTLEPDNEQAQKLSARLN